MSLCKDGQKVDPVECKACDAKLPMTWCVQSRQMVHIRGLATFTCERVAAEQCEKKARLQREKAEARLQRADQKGR